MKAISIVFPTIPKFSYFGLASGTEVHFQNGK